MPTLMRSLMPLAHGHQETLPQHSTSLKHLCDILSGTETRLLVVGGAGSLYVNPEHTVQVMDGPDFPDVFKPLASNMGKALEELRARNDVKWTYVSPAGDFRADGAKTGSYLLGGEGLGVKFPGRERNQLRRLCGSHDG